MNNCISPNSLFVKPDYKDPNVLLKNIDIDYLKIKIFDDGTFCLPDSDWLHSSGKLTYDREYLFNEYVEYKDKHVFLDEPEFYRHCEVYDFIEFFYEIEAKSNSYRKLRPFSKDFLDKYNVTIQWPSIILPKAGIREMVEAKIKDEPLDSFKELHFLIQVPWMSKDTNDFGIWTTNISISFRGDKTYKYGDINNSKAEFAYFIETRASRTNDYYIIDGTAALDFINEYLRNNQWGKGSGYNIHNPADDCKEMMEKSRLYRVLRSYQYNEDRMLEKESNAKEK